MAITATPSAAKRTGASVRRSHPPQLNFMPAIIRLERAPKVFYAFGHAHLGLTETPITSEIVCAIATDKQPPIDLAPFRVERFG